MTTPIFTKQYETLQQADAARAHHDWLSQLDSGVRIPALQPSAGAALVFEHLDGRQPEPDDLPTVAAALGQVHAAAYTRHLHAARLNKRFRVSDQLVLADFITPRRAVLAEAFGVLDLPVALYKDANIRNFILTDDGVAIIDFDDLTLAPFGYDLAKLVVSAAMTQGHLDPHLLERTLDIYNTRTAAVGADAVCELRRFQLYTEVHHRLTAHYLDQHGYHHAWPDVRPWVIS